MATHSSILVWEIPWTEEPGELQSMGSQSRTRLSAHPHTAYWGRARRPKGQGRARKEGSKEVNLRERGRGGLQDKLKAHGDCKHSKIRFF